MGYCSSMKSRALLLALSALSALSALMFSGALVHAQRVGQPMSGARPGARPPRTMSPPPPAITNPIRPSANPVVPPAVAVPPALALSPLRPSSPFEARPRTYAPRFDPRYDRPARRGGFYGPYYSGGLGLDDVALAPPADAAFPVESDGPQFLYPPPQAAPAPVTLPHAPDTYYVIPGCYMGNRPPNKEQLPT